MKSLPALILALILFAAVALCGSGCTKPKPACPDGAKSAGATPPQGLAQWCEKKNDSGQVVYHGAYTSWYKNGKKAVRAFYKDGYLHGNYSFGFENGQTAKQGEYIKGKEEGLWTFRFENGKVKMMGAYKNGQPVGEWSFYDPAGKQTKARYISGKLVK